jgi:DNA-binding MarR family transcriptional regulator
MDSEIIELLAYVKISKYRTKILNILGKEMKFPSQLAKDLNLRTNEGSKLVRGLKEKKLVEVLNPEAKLGRFYKLTELGNEVLKNL